MLAHPANCHQYYNCSGHTPLTWFVSQLAPDSPDFYLYECPYPQLFNEGTLRCENYRDVKCGEKFLPLDPCKTTITHYTLHKHNTNRSREQRYTISVNSIPLIAGRYYFSLPLPACEFTSQSSSLTVSMSDFIFEFFFYLSFHFLYSFFLYFFFVFFFLLFSVFFFFSIYFSSCLAWLPSSF